MFQSLQAAGNARDLIVFVETWAQAGEPSVAARLALANAYFELGQMDKAWSRARALTDRNEGGQVAVDLLRRAGAPVSRPDEPRGSADDLDTQLRLAEHYLATGASIKARTVLERLSKQHPTHSRVADLLWGLRGDSSTIRTLWQLVELWGGPLAVMPVLPDANHETENTESITTVEAPQVLPVGEPGARGGVAFPSLFRQASPASDDDDEDTDERTVALSMASARELHDSPIFTDDPDSGLPDAEGDTQIVRVIHRPGTSPKEPARAFDLRAPPPSDFDDLVADDDDLIVLRRQEPIAEARFDAPPATTPQTTPPVTPQPLGARPRRRRVWPWLLAIFVVAAFAGAAAIMIALYSLIF